MCQLKPNFTDPTDPVCIVLAFFIQLCLNLVAVGENFELVKLQIILFHSSFADQQRHKRNLMEGAALELVCHRVVIVGKTERVIHTAVEV